jgi:hypothetical protein
MRQVLKLPADAMINLFRYTFGTRFGETGPTPLFATVADSETVEIKKAR